MKHKRAWLFILTLVLTLSMSAIAESLVPLELGMPFGIIHSTGSASGTVYENEDIKAAERIGILKDGDIVQILAVYSEKGSCRIYYFDAQHRHQVSYISSGAVEQLTIAGLISIMQDPEKAVYMKQFIGESLPYVTGNLESVTKNSTLMAAAVMPGLTDENETRPAKQPPYILNLNTKRFHLPSCRSINDINSKNFEAFEGTRDEAIH